MGRDLSVFVHLIGMALWLGGMFAAGIWTLQARRSGDAGVVAFAYGTARALYRGVVAVAATLSVLSGALLVFITQRPWFRPFPEHWLFQMQVFGLAAFLTTLLYLVPNAGTLARLAERAVAGEASPDFEVGVKRQAIVASLIGAVLFYLVFLGAVRF
jgi:uncharacterized membrane protein